VHFTKRWAGQPPAASKPPNVASLVGTDKFAEGAPLVATVAERDMVILLFVMPRPDPLDPNETYQSAHFDAFRLKDGKIVEHWDATGFKIAPGLPPR
jgi:predicted SnoaL-like aldol condensation-catalyzing enzyme